jgi:hypothetical protein
MVDRRHRRAADLEVGGRGRRQRELERKLEPGLRLE